MTTETLTLSTRTKAKLKLDSLAVNPFRNQSEEDIVKMVKEAMSHPDLMEELLTNIVLKLNTL